MPIKHDDGRIEPFAGELPPGEGRLRSPENDPREPYFVGDFTDDEKTEWTGARDSDVAKYGSYNEAPQ